jgi:hypothetical protein
MTPLQFETANGTLWSEFEGLLAKKEETQLNPERFLTLYRSTCEHLALAQARGFPTHLIERLSILTARGHQIVYRQSDFGLHRIGHVLLSRFPALVRAHWRYVISAALILMVPALALGVATYARPELVLSLVDSRTAGSFEQMYGPSAHVIGRVRNAGDDWMMFGFYIMNNIGIAFQCYVTGILVRRRQFVVSGVQRRVRRSDRRIYHRPRLWRQLLSVHRHPLGFRIDRHRAERRRGAAHRPFCVIARPVDTGFIAAGGRARDQCHHLRGSRDAGHRRRHRGVLVLGRMGRTSAKYICAAACWALVALFFLRRPHAS